MRASGGTAPVRNGYARISTEDQSLNLQIDALRAAGCERIFQDRVSGKSRRRAGLEAALAATNANDQLVVWRLDRLGRNFRDLVQIADELRERKANLISISEGIDTSSAVGEVIFRLMSVFSDFERNVIVERTVAGLAAVRARGVALGRKPKLSPHQVSEARLRLANGEKAAAIAQSYGCGRSTLFRSLGREEIASGDG